MPHFFIILLKINLVLILFAAAYYFILRHLTFYVINRVFLAFGILFSTVYPFIDLTDFFHRQNTSAVAFVPEINQQVKSLVPTGFIGEYWQWLGGLFYVGVAFMAFRLIVQFVSLYKMHKKSLPGSVANFEVRILKEPVSPFSFWQTVYINPSLHQERELHTILAHEQIHVKEWHSLDIILAELSVVFYWFNPGVWLMKRAVKENLEFITDEKILKKGVDKKAYQYSLLDVGNLMPAVEIVNNFNLSDLKKRIKMMNVKRSSKLTLSRYMLVLPVLLLTTLAFTVSKKDIKKHFAPIKQALIKANIIDSVKEDITASLNKEVVNQKIKKAQTTETSVDTATKFNFIINSVQIRKDTANSNVAETFNPEQTLVLATRKNDLPGSSDR
ncbi:MAG: M56 family metallopeptidase [Pedobacter sp.]|nr:MAG: M56 family metallopeptidase [Pedobacter sp.]